MKFLSKQSRYSGFQKPLEKDRTQITVKEVLLFPTMRGTTN